jgi:hypothetical protein
MLERIMHEYHGAFAPNYDENRDLEEPEPVRRVAKKAAMASWKSLAAEDLEGTNPTRRRPHRLPTHILKALKEREPPIKQPGDLWVFGGRCLLCGDAPAAKSYVRLLGPA